MKKITIAFFITMFLLLRPYQLQSHGLIYGGDDYSYFAYSTAFAFGQYPNFDKELFDEASIPPLSRVGAGLMAAPFVAAFSIVDRAQHKPIVEKRTRETIIDSWSLYGAIFAACVFFWLSCLLLYKSLRLQFSQKSSELAVILMTFMQGVPLYAFRRPVFSHIYELFLQSFLFYVFVKNLYANGDEKKEGDLKLALQVALLCALSMLVRQNATPYALFWPLAIFIFALKKIDFKNMFVTFAVSWLLYIGIKYYPWILAKEKYEAVNKLFEGEANLAVYVKTAWFFLKRTHTVFLGADWGLVYTAPFYLMALLALIKSKLKFSKLHALVALPLLANFYILVIWRGQGSWYGYRYFLFTALPVLVYPFADLIERLQGRSKYAVTLLWTIAIVPFLSMLLFETDPSHGLDIVMNEFGNKNWGNLNYQFEVWKTVFNKPADVVYALFKVGPAYVAYLFANLFGMLDKLPAKIFNVYPTFNIELMIKMLLAYATPFALYFTSRFE